MTKKPCVFAKRVLRFYLQSFCLSDNTHVTATKFALAVPHEKYQFAFLMREFKLCVYKFTARARRRTRCRGSLLTVKTISCLWKLEWLAKCSTKVWKFPGSDQHSRHVWTIFWRFSNILLKFSHVSVLFLLDKVQIRFTRQEDLYVTHGKMCTVLTCGNSSTTW